MPEPRHPFSPAAVEAAAEIVKGYDDADAALTAAWAVDGERIITVLLINQWLAERRAEEAEPRT